jgi:hypothetical protein
MFEEFSAGYYVGQLYIGLSDGEYAVMEREQHEEANEQIYTTGEGVERVDHQLVMKVDESHFPVFSADDVPTDTLAVPDDVLEATRIDDPPTVREVLVAKAERAAQLLEWFTSYTVKEPEFA